MKFSIIINYNKSGLQVTIERIINQTYTNFKSNLVLYAREI